MHYNWSLDNSPAVEGLSKSRYYFSFGFNPNYQGGRLLQQAPQNANIRFCLSLAPNAMSLLHVIRHEVPHSGSRWCFPPRESIPIPLILFPKEWKLGPYERLSGPQGPTRCRKTTASIANVRHGKISHLRESLAVIASLSRIKLLVVF